MCENNTLLIPALLIVPPLILVISGKKRDLFLSAWSKLIFINNLIALLLRSRVSSG